MELLLSIDVRLDECIVVKNDETEVRFIRFHGGTSSECFKGTILPGGVDTQLRSDEHFTLSARYILEGVDYTGEKCRIFIENNGFETEEGLHTKPRMITDSKALQELFAGELYGGVEGADGGVIIRIYRK